MRVTFTARAARRKSHSRLIASAAHLRYTQRMPKRTTTDHGEIIHFAGRKRLFPVARFGEVRLASKDEVQPGEARVGWPAYFRPFIDRGLVFLYDESGGQAVTRAEAGRRKPARLRGPEWLDGMDISRKAAPRPRPRSSRKWPS